jgi:hypothetical protein
LNPLAPWADYFVGLAAGWTGGLFLLAASSLASLAIAWVLLVEVRRWTAGPGR